MTSVFIMVLMTIAKKPKEFSEISEIERLSFPNSRSKPDYFATTRDLILITKDHDTTMTIGYIQLRKDRDTKALWIHTLATHPEHRHKGVGTQLLCETEKYAKSHGFREILLSVLEDNHEAHGLYLKYGFIPSENSTTTMIKKLIYVKNI